MRMSPSSTRRAGGRASVVHAGDFLRPYFCAEQETKWYAPPSASLTGRPNGLMQELAKKHQMAMVVPIYEEEMTGVYYNTAAVIDADGSYLGKYRKNHIPHAARLLGEVLLHARHLGYPVFETRYAQGRRLHLLRPSFPRGRARARPERGRICVQPHGDRRRPLAVPWKLEQPAHAVANGYFVGAINRVGTEAPWNFGEFYGQSYFVNPRGKIEGSPAATRTNSSSMTWICNAGGGNGWQFYRDRRPETYGPLTEIG